MGVELPVHVPCDSCSFSVIVRNVLPLLNVPYVESRMSPVLLNVTDAKWFIDDFYRPYCYRKMVLWGDTPFKVDGEYPRDCEIRVFATSEFVKSLVSGAVEVYGVLYPAFNVIAYKKRGLEKKYWFAFIGSEPPELGLDRKRIPFTISVLKEYGKYKESLVVSNFEGSHLKSGMLSEPEKYEVLARSRFYVALSRVEGFGLGLMEAMAVGTPAVYVNAYSFKEFAVGIPIDDYEYSEIETRFGVMPSYEVKERDVLYALKEAEECAYTSCYDDLVAKALERSRLFDPFKVAKALAELLNDVTGFRLFSLRYSNLDELVNNR